MSKELKTRIQHKIDTAEKWNESTIVPLEGELIIYSNGNSTANLEGIDPNIKAPAFKIGDGSHKVGELPFATLGIELDPDYPGSGGDEPIIPDPDNPTITVVPIPVITSGVMIYTGSTITPSWDTNITESNYYTCSGQLEGNSAGTYTTTFTLKNTETTKWSNDSTEPQTVTWQIQKAVGRATISGPTASHTFDAPDFEGGTTVDFTLYSDYEGTLDYRAPLNTTYIAPPTINYISKEGNLYKHSMSIETGDVVPEEDGSIQISIYQDTENVSSAQDYVFTVYYKAPVFEEKTLEDYSWDEISQISINGTAENYFRIGDKKEIVLNGKIGQGCTLDNYTTYVYIIDFNHANGDKGSHGGIQFGTFKTADGTSICLVDGYYGKNFGDDTGAPPAGTSEFFTMETLTDNPSTWRYSQIRYNILGSTDSADGGNPSIDSAPIGTDTLIGALPEDLHQVLKPMIIWTYNAEGSPASDSPVSPTVDYLPLLSEIEVYGLLDSPFSSGAEIASQSQYTYYKSGNSCIKYRYDDVENVGEWWLRTRNSASGSKYLSVSSTNGPNDSVSTYSRGIAPVFTV